MTMQEIQAKTIFYKNEYNWLMLYDSAVDRDIELMNVFLTENAILNPLT